MRILPLCLLRIVLAGTACGGPDVPFAADGEAGSRPGAVPASPTHVADLGLAAGTVNTTAWASGPSEGNVLAGHPPRRRFSTRVLVGAPRSSISWAKDDRPTR